MNPHSSKSFPKVESGSDINQSSILLNRVAPELSLHSTSSHRSAVLVHDSSIHRDDSRTSKIFNVIDPFREKEKIVYDKHMKHSGDFVFETDVVCLRYSALSGDIAAGLANGTIKVFNTERDFFQTLNDHDTIFQKVPCTFIRFFDEDLYTIMACYSSGIIKTWNYENGTCLRTLKEKRQLFSLAVCPEKTRFATVGSEPEINIYDMETGKVMRQLQSSYLIDKMDGHHSRVFCVQYHPNYPHQLFSAGWDHTIQMWDDRIDQAQRKIYGPFVCGDGLELLDNHILTASWRKNNPLEIWDFSTGRKLSDVNLDAYVSHLYCCRWMGPNHILCGGSQDNNALVIDRRDNSIIGSVTNFSKAVCTVECSFNDNLATVYLGSSETCHLASIVLPSKRIIFDESDTQI